MLYVLDTLDRNKQELDILYDKILFHADKDVAEFIIQNLSNNEIKEDPYFWYKWRCPGKSIRLNAALLIDQSKPNREDDLNEHFRWINNSLVHKGVYVSCIETTGNREKTTLKNNKKFTDFISSLFISKRKSLSSSKNNNHKIPHKIYSLAELLGRLAYSGFEILNYKNIENMTYIISRKKSNLQISNPSSSRSIVKMERIGKNGKIIQIYKIRTMYPYSEFIQDYVAKKNGYNLYGKPDNDFRLIKYGKLLRKLYIDEIPQFYNFLKGEINLVGVRPMSKFGFSSLPPDLQKERIKFKPGLIPPHIALGLIGWDGVIKAERIYLEEYKKSPLKTNLKYLFLSVFNILTFKAKGN